VQGKSEVKPSQIRRYGWTGRSWNQKSSSKDVNACNEYVAWICYIPLQVVTYQDRSEGKVSFQTDHILQSDRSSIEERRERLKEGGLFFGLLLEWRRVIKFIRIGYEWLVIGKSQHVSHKILTKKTYDTVSPAFQWDVVVRFDGLNCISAVRSQNKRQSLLVTLTRDVLFDTEWLGNTIGILWLETHTWYPPRGPVIVEPFAKVIL
jgi:hypothetical protein